MGLSLPLKLLENPRNSQGLTGAHRGSQGLTGAHKGSQRLSGGLRGSQEQCGAGQDQGLREVEDVRCHQKVPEKANCRSKSHSHRDVTDLGCSQQK